MSKSQFDELEVQDLKNIFNIPIQYHMAAENNAAIVFDEQFRKIHERKVKTYLKAIGELSKTKE